MRSKPSSWSRVGVHIHVHIHTLCMSLHYAQLPVFLLLYFVCVSLSIRPQVALRIIVPKLRHENEKVNMLSLTVRQNVWRCLWALHWLILPSYQLSPLFSSPLPSPPLFSSPLSSPHPLLFLSHLHAVTWGMCKKLWPEIPSRTWKVSLSQWTSQNALRKSENKI